MPTRISLSQLAYFGFWRWQVLTLLVVVKQIKLSTNLLKKKCQVICAALCGNIATIFGGIDIDHLVKLFHYFQVRMQLTPVYDHVSQRPVLTTEKWKI